MLAPTGRLTLFKLIYRSVSEMKCYVLLYILHLITCQVLYSQTAPISISDRTYMKHKTKVSTSWSENTLEHMRDLYYLYYYIALWCIVACMWCQVCVFNRDAVNIVMCVQKLRYQGNRHNKKYKMFKLKHLNIVTI